MTEKLDSQCRSMQDAEYPAIERRKTCLFAEQASDVALHKFMMTFGYDIEKSADRARLLDMIKFLEGLSKFASRSFMSFAGIFALFIAAVIALGFKKWFGQ